MKDFAVITAFRDTGDTYRRRNLAACIATVAENFPEAEHVVVEQGDLPDSGKWFGSQGFSGVIHELVNTGCRDDLFHKPILLNSAVEAHPGRKLYVMVDADVYLERPLVDFVIAEGGEGKLVYPFGDVIYMDEMDTRLMVKEHRLWVGLKDHGVTIRRQTGLMMAFTYGDFKKVRGFDREFAAWGAEDDAFMFKFIRAGMEVVRNPDGFAVAYHMFHPKVNTKEYTDGVIYQKNRILCACIRRMGDEDFAGYLSGEIGLDSLVDKYRKLGRLEISLDWIIVKRDLAAGIKNDVAIHMDTTIYDIDRSGEMSIDKILSEVYLEDGPEGVIVFVEGVFNRITGVPEDIRADIDRWYAAAKEGRSAPPKSIKERYRRIANSKEFKDAYEGKSLGEVMEIEE